MHGSLMKEKYFTSDNISGVSEKILREVSGYIRRGHEFTPENSALLITDMQDYFLREDAHAYIPSSAAIIENIKALAAACGEHNIPVIFTRHVNNNANAGMMAKWWKELITKDNPLSNISGVFEKTNCTILIKPQYDAFFGTTLHQILRSKGTDRLIISGVMANLCCETTARSAFVHGYEVFLPVDATAAYNYELHLSAVRNLAHGFAVPLLTNDLTENIRKASHAG